MDMTTGASVRQRRFWVILVGEWVVPLLIALPVLWALLPGGLPNTADGTVHFIRAVEMLHAWQDGVLLPRWSENLGYGYGIPLFVYAPPLPYQLAVALTYLSGMNLETAFKGMMVLAVLLAVFGAYRLSRTIATLGATFTHKTSAPIVLVNRLEMAGLWTGAVGAAAFLYAPIMLRELFIQGNIAQYLAWTFPPWAAWAIVRIYQTGLSRRARQPEGGPLPGQNQTDGAVPDQVHPRGHGYGHLLVLAFALLGTLLSHNAAALLLMGMIGGLGVALFVATRDLRSLGLTVAGSLLGLGLGFWFWGPALLEGEYVQLHHIVASDFRPRFIPLTELLALSPPLDSGAINPYFPLTLGAVQVWLGAGGILAFLVYLLSRLVVHGLSRFSAQPESARRLDIMGATLPNGSHSLLSGVATFFVLFALFCAFMATHWSEPVWSVLPFVDLFEWPFRWHGFSALGLSWLCAFALFALIQALQGGLPDRGFSLFSGHVATTLLGVLALLLLMGSALVNLYPQKLLPGMRIASAYEVVRYEVKSSAVGTTSLGEFNSIWVEGVIQPSPLVDAYLARQPVDRLPTPLASGTRGEQIESTVHRQQFRLHLEQPAQITLNLLYFPGWQASIDGQPVALRPQPQNGLIEVDLPAGDYTLMLTFGPTRLRWMAGLVSVLAWSMVLLYGVVMALRWLLLLFKARQRRREKSLDTRDLRRQPPFMGRTAAASIWSAMGAIFVLTALLLGVRATQAERFVRHSPPDQSPSTDGSVRADFAEKLRLLGVDLPPRTSRAGSPITVIAYWRALHALEDDYAVFLHLDIPTTGETIATTDQLHPSDIPTSGWATGQYVRNPLTLVAPADALPIQYSLRIGVYDHDGHLLDRSDGEGDTVEVGRFWITPQTQPDEPREAKYRFGDTIELLGVETSDDAVTLYWRAQAPIEYPYSIFVHLLDGDGTLLGQLDGAPYTNRYPLPAWQPGQRIVDRRSLTEATPDIRAVARLAIGVYDPRSGARLTLVAAADTEDANLHNDSVLVEFH